MVQPNPFGRAENVSDAVMSRRSVRAFLPEAPATDQISTILTKAARAPSGTNMQPWQALVVTGDTRERLCTAACKEFDSPKGPATSEIPYYPERWFEPFLSRRRKVGWDLYSLLGIKKGDREKTAAQHRRNFTFFDAPVGILFTVHRDLATGSWLDYGMYLQSIMLLAREQGLDSCPQAAWADYHQVVREVLPIPDEHIVICGMALGYADPGAIENTLTTERAPIADYVTFLD